MQACIKDRVGNHPALLPPDFNCYTIQFARRQTPDRLMFDGNLESQLHKLDLADTDVNYTKATASVRLYRLLMFFGF